MDLYKGPGGPHSPSKSIAEGGGVEEKGVQNGAKLVQKNAHGETYDGKIATLSHNDNV